MSYIEKTLVPGEQVVYRTRLHWVVMLGHLFSAGLLIVLGAFLLYYRFYHSGIQVQDQHVLEWSAAASLTASLLVVLMGNLRRHATEMAVTNRRVVVKTGLASRRTIEMLLGRVETIEVNEPAFGRLFGFGSIAMIGTGGTAEQFHQIAHPVDFRNEVQQQIEKLLPTT